MREPVHEAPPKIKRTPIVDIPTNGNHPPSPEAALLAGVRLLARHQGVVEARMVKVPRKGTVSGYFDHNHYEQLVNALVPYDHQVNIYVTLNPINPDLQARAVNRLKERAEDTTSDAEILRRAWFPIDLDPHRAKGISSTQMELATALTRADAIVAFLTTMLGFPKPVEIMSGNGAHLLFPVDLPNDEVTTTLFKQALAALKAKFSDGQVDVDTTVVNAARIWKLPGSWAVKGDPTDERPHRRATITAQPTQLVDVSRDLLAELAALAPSGSSAGPSTGRSGGGGYAPLDVVGAVTAKGWYRENLGGGKHGILCPWQAEHSGDSGVSEAAIFEPAPPERPWWGFKCLHAHCGNRTIRDLLQVLDLHATADPGTRTWLRADEGDLKVATEEAWAVLAEKNEPPVILTVGDEVVHLAHVQEDESDPVRLQPLSASWLPRLSNRKAVVSTARWVGVRAKGRPRSFSRTHSSMKRTGSRA